MFETFAKEHLRRRWSWGETDCALSLADWAVWNGDADPAVDLRGTYDTEVGCLAVVEAAGGLIELVRGCCEAIAAPEVFVPVYGCVAVIGSATVPRRQWGAIFDGLNWRVRMVDGYPAVTAMPLRMWTI